VSDVGRRSFARNDALSVQNEAEGPDFREPWEAQAFALAVSLQQRGVISRSEWSDALGEAIRKAQAAGDPDTGETYYHHWLAALESIVTAKGLADAQALARTRDAWAHACARTPHGTPIGLRADDFADR
jgi:nitrile hydratase accessory protein